VDRTGRVIERRRTTMFTLSDAVLNRVFEVNRFMVPRDELENSIGAR